jgi:tetratricopeptide (TPR) repeat protein
VKPFFSETELMDQLADATEQVKEGNLEKAISSLKTILDNRPDHEIALGLLASIYLQIGMNEQAIKYYQALLNVNPDNPLARFQLGMAQLATGQPELALETWEPMLKLKNEFMANFHSALALLQLNRPQEALNQLLDAGRHMPSSHPLYPQLLELHAQLTIEKEN